MQVGPARRQSGNVENSNPLLSPDEDCVTNLVGRDWQRLLRHSLHCQTGFRDCRVDESPHAPRQWKHLCNFLQFTRAKAQILRLPGPLHRQNHGEALDCKKLDAPHLELLRSLLSINFHRPHLDRCGINVCLTSASFWRNKFGTHCLALNIP